MTNRKKSELPIDTDKIRKARGDRPIGATAKALEISYQYLWAIETGKKKPSLDLFMRMASYYRKDPRWFIAA